MRRLWRCWLALALACAAAPPALAHKPSDSYLTLEVSDSGVRGQWDIALRDLDFAVGLDADGNGEITWGELRARHAEIAAYALAALTLSADGHACTLRPGEQLVDDHSDGAYSVLKFDADCGRRPHRLEVGYRLFADLDPQHRGLLRLVAGGPSRSAVLGPQAPSQAFDLQELGWGAQFADYAKDGIWHIWVGYDHILFLLSLLLPAVLVWQPPRWQAASSAREAFWEVLRIVTAFTVAHSITLSLATLKVVALPSRAVESAIAASVVLAALNNVVPLVHGRRWAVAFGFGLIHGFGFASVLADLGLPRGTLALALVGFNVGVELGQLAIVATLLPLAFHFRRTWAYQRLVFVGGSAAIAMVAAVWLAERVGDFKVLPF